jgi:hypothetical protein
MILRLLLITCVAIFVTYSAKAQTACKSEEECKSFIYKPHFCKEGRAKYKREKKDVWKAYCKVEGVKRG